MIKVADPEAQALVEENALCAQVRAAVEALPAVERQVVALHFGEGLSERAIARVLGVSKSWVHRRLQSALARLRADLGVNDEKYGRVGEPVGESSSSILSDSGGRDR